MSSTWKNNIEITLFGESHGKAIGVVLGNIPAGIKIDEKQIQEDMARRAPGTHPLVTQRKEADTVQILSGILEGYTTGAPICGMIENKDQHSKDYDILKSIMRPGHSDYAAYLKYHGYHDIRGGGHFSARLTACLVFAGSIARQILRLKDIEIGSHLLQIHHLKDDEFPHPLTKETLISLQQGNYRVLNEALYPQIEELLMNTKEKQDSVGAIIECGACSIPYGLGDPFFDSFESHLSSLIFSIPGVKGIQFGKGFDFVSLYGSEANDTYYYENDQVYTNTNHNGGILGGITYGMPITFSVAFKPTSSISKPQETINVNTKENTTLTLTGRHDPCIALRASVIVESVLALVLLDYLRYEYK